MAASRYITFVESVADQHVMAELGQMEDRTAEIAVLVPD
jgi:hypothetical protein